MRQFSWKHPWSNAADTYFAEHLRERYLYVYPGRDYQEPDARERLRELSRRIFNYTVLGIGRRRGKPPLDSQSIGSKESGQDAVPSKGERE